MNAQEINQLATTVARKYARKCWWADIEDLTQEACLAVCKALRTFDPDVGVPAKAYCYRAAVLTLRRYLWKASSPVSEADNKLPTLAGVHRAEVPETLTAATNLESEAIRREWNAGVHKRVLELLDGIDGADLAEAVLLKDRDREDLSATRKEITQAVSKVRCRIRNDYPLYQMWKQMT